MQVAEPDHVILHRLKDCPHCQTNRYKSDLEREEKRERRKLVDAERKRERDQLNFQRTIRYELETQRHLARQIQPVPQSIVLREVEYDLFISHASEDKDDFVRPLANALKSLGVKVWYDEFTLKIGDSLRGSIDRGFGIWQMQNLEQWCCHILSFQRIGLNMSSMEW